MYVQSLRKIDKYVTSLETFLQVFYWGQLEGTWFCLDLRLGNSENHISVVTMNVALPLSEDDVSRQAVICVLMIFERIFNFDKILLRSLKLLQW
jgi:hypothetical protein